MKPVQPELPQLADYRVETVFVDQFEAAVDRLRADGFQVLILERQVGRGTYVLRASRVNRPDLDRGSLPS